MHCSKGLTGRPWSFEVVGTPRGKPAWLSGKGAKGKREVRARWTTWRGEIRRAALGALRGGLSRPVFAPGVPLVLEVTFWLARPGGHHSARGGLRLGAPLVPAVKPDLSNLIKGLEDALDGIAYAGDQQIVDHLTRKRYADDGREPGASVSLAPLA